MRFGGKFFSGLLFVLLCAWLGKVSYEHINKKAKFPNTHFFVEIPLASFNSINLPCLEIEAESQLFLMLLDTGFAGYISINSDDIEKFQKKEFVSIRSMHGWRGKNYEENVYEIPRIKIGPTSFNTLFLQEQNQSFCSDAKIISNNEVLLDHTKGSLGWKLFEKSNLFLDLSDSKIAFCDSISTLNMHKYKLDSFARTPLILDRNLVEFDMFISGRTYRCLLDSGSTWNILDVENQKNEVLDEMALNPERRIKFASFQIGGSDFGELTFRELPICLPIKVDAILGMEFLKKHRVFIDFKGKQIYFARVI